MKTVMSLKESIDLLMDELDKKSLKARKRKVTKWINEEQEFLKEIKLAVDKRSGWYLGERYNIADIWRSETWLKWMQDYRIKLDQETQNKPLNILQ